MASKGLLTAEVSLRDVEPVKSFIGAIADIRNDSATPTGVREKIDQACMALYNGFGSLKPSTSDEMIAQRGWRLSKDTVAHPDREQWPSVCIVIPVFNSPELLKRCLITLMKTQYPGELYHTCVDNASTDPETLKILADRNFSAIRFENPVGFAQAVNTGIRQTESLGADYYVLFNQDCAIIDDDWLTHLINWMELRPQCAVAGPKLLYPDGTIQHAGIDIPHGGNARHRHLRKRDDLPEANFYAKVQAVTGAVFAIRTSMIDEVGYLDEGYTLGSEDIEYCLRVATDAGKEVWYVPDSVVMHVDNGVRKTNPQDKERIRRWQIESDKRFRDILGGFVDTCAAGSVAFVLPDYNPVAGGCRVVGALANYFINSGVETTIYTPGGKRCAADTDFPELFQVLPLESLKTADILIATRFDTVESTQHIPARRRFYLVQQIETCMAKYCGLTEEDAIRSYRHTEYEIITIGEHLAKQLAEMGRTARVLDVGFYRDAYAAQSSHRDIRTPARILMYGSPADYKGACDQEAIATAIRERCGKDIVINSFHRDCPKPDWSDEHFRPQSTREVARVYADHDVYVYPSLSDGFAMTPVEAMACGTPVVLTNFPGKDQYAHHGFNCRIAPFRDAQGVAEEVVYLIARPAEREKLRQNGIFTAARYDWSKVGKQYVDAILKEKNR